MIGFGVPFVLGDFDRDVGGDDAGAAEAEATVVLACTGMTGLSGGVKGYCVCTVGARVGTESLMAGEAAEAGKGVATRVVGVNTSADIGC